MGSKRIAGPRLASLSTAIILAAALPLAAHAQTIRGGLWSVRTLAGSDVPLDLSKEQARAAGVRLGADRFVTHYCLPAQKLVPKDPVPGLRIRYEDVSADRFIQIYKEDGKPDLRDLLTWVSADCEDLAYQPLPPGGEPDPAELARVTAPATQPAPASADLAGQGGRAVPGEFEPGFAMP